MKLHHQDDLRLRHVYRADVGHDVARSKKKEAIVARDEYQSEYYFPADRFVVKFRMTPMGLSTTVPASGPNIVPEGATVPSRAPEGCASRPSMCLGYIGGHLNSRKEERASRNEISFAREGVLSEAVSTLRMVGRV